MSKIQNNMFTIEFKGKINHYFKFNSNDYNAIYPQERGSKLYINGTEILINSDRYDYVRQKIEWGINSGKEVVDIVFVVDYDGNCICARSYYGSNQLSRFLSKLLG